MDTETPWFLPENLNLSEGRPKGSLNPLKYIRKPLRTPPCNHSRTLEPLNAPCKEPLRTPKILHLPLKTPFKNCWSHPKKLGGPPGRHWDPPLCTNGDFFFQICLKKDWWTLFFFLSLHSRMLFVFRYLEELKAILYCSRSSLNCDLR